MVSIFKDFEIIKLERDWEGSGVFLKARRPSDWRPVDLAPASGFRPRGAHGEIRR
jgi:hypothetical protein